MNDKPSWKDAPEWAKFLARDSNGLWTWFEYEPRLIHSTYYTMKGRSLVCPYNKVPNILQERPV